MPEELCVASPVALPLCSAVEPEVCPSAATDQEVSNQVVCFEKFQASLFQESKGYESIPDSAGYGQCSHQSQSNRVRIGCSARDVCLSFLFSACRSRVALTLALCRVSDELEFFIHYGDVVHWIRCENEDDRNQWMEDCRAAVRLLVACRSCLELLTNCTR